MEVQTVNLRFDALSGEWQDEHDEADLTPHIGGCGQALVIAAMALLRGNAAATPHLEACSPCREALIALGTLAGGLDALAYFEGLNTEAPHAAELAGVAA